MIRRFLRAIFTPPMIALAALFMLIEEWLWTRLTLVMAQVARLPVLQRLEAWMATLPPGGAMVCFLMPGALLLPVNLFAIALTAGGHALAGGSILIGAKLLGTAILARIFAVTRPTLLTVDWFRRAYEWLIRTKTWLYSTVKQSRAWQAAGEWKRQISARLGRLTHRWRGGHLRRRWKAVVLSHRRRFGRGAADSPPRP